MPCFAIKLLAFSAQQCVPFVWESTSDGLLFKAIDVACKSCLKKKKKKRHYRLGRFLRTKKEVFQFSKNPFFPTIKVKPDLATKINELDGFSISAVPILSLTLL